MASMPEDSNIDEDKDEDDKEDKDEDDKEDDKEDNNEDDKEDDNGFFTVASREDIGKEKCRTLRLVCPVSVCK